MVYESGGRVEAALCVRLMGDVSREGSLIRLARPSNLNHDVRRGAIACLGKSLFPLHNEKKENNKIDPC